MTTSRTKLKSLAERGLARTLAAQVPPRLRDGVIGDVRLASPLEFSREAAQTLEKVRRLPEGGLAEGGLGI